MNNYHSIDRSNNSIQSKVISFLRFPLIVAVVLIHTEPHTLINKNLNGIIVYNVVYNLVSEVIAGAAVPIFFLFSGFLFFNKPKFTPHIYIYKLKNRAKTILIPYIIWNIIVYFILYLKHLLYSTDLSDSSIVTNLSGIDWIRIFWDIRSNFYPLCAQFWFLRDLMVMMVLSPIIYLSIKALNIYIILIWGLFWTTNYWIDIPGLSITSILFFSMGAYFGIKKENFINKLSPLLKPAIILYPVICITVLLFYHTSWIHYIKALCILIEIILCLEVSAYYLSKGSWNINNFLSESSFFIYAYHQIFLALTVKIIVTTFIPDSGLELLIIYAFSALIIILLGLVIYYILRNFCPKLTNILTGGR